MGLRYSEDLVSHLLEGVLDLDSDIVIRRVPPFGMDGLTELNRD